VSEEKTTKKGLVARVKEAVKRYSFFGKVEEIADKRRTRFNREVREARILVKQCERELDTLRGRGTSPEPREVEDQEQLLTLAEHHLRKMLRKRKFWRDRYVWAHERHAHWGVVLKHRRDRVRRWVQQHQDFQPYMANGNPYERLTAEAKHGIYLDFRGGLYVTSTYEGFPGDGVHSTSSGHYVQNQPDDRARCWDAGAGSRGPMAKAQLREAERAASFMVELIGPENDFEYKNGIRYSLAEGDPLETMHDNHKHTWIRDGAPV
jgi:hypothetical protein